MAMYLSGAALRQIFSYLLGGFDTARPGPSSPAPRRSSRSAASLILLRARSLNGLLLGEEAAAHLGIDVRRERAILLALASLVTAAAVAVSGLIGFVGLVVPARRPPASSGPTRGSSCRCRRSAGRRSSRSRTSWPGCRRDPGRGRDRADRRAVLPLPAAPVADRVRAVIELPIGVTGRRTAAGPSSATVDLADRGGGAGRADRAERRRQVDPAARSSPGSSRPAAGERPARRRAARARSTGARSPGDWRSSRSRRSLPFAMRVEEVVGPRPAAARGPVPGRPAGRSGGGRGGDRAGRDRAPPRPRRPRAVPRRAAAGAARAGGRPGDADPHPRRADRPPRPAPPGRRRWSCSSTSTNATARRSSPCSTTSAWPRTSSRASSCSTRGRIVADGPPAEVLTPDRIRDVFGVDPSLVRLAWSRSRLHVRSAGMTRVALDPDHSGSDRSPPLSSCVLVAAARRWVHRGCVPDPARRRPPRRSAPRPSPPRADESAAADASEASPSEEPTGARGSHARPVAEPAAPSASAGPSAAAACSGNRTRTGEFFVAAATALEWPVYCARPAGRLVRRLRRVPAGRWWPARDRLQGPRWRPPRAPEGAFCHGRRLRPERRRGRRGGTSATRPGRSWRLDDGGWAIVVDRDGTISWVAIGHGHRRRGVPVDRRRPRRRQRLTKAASARRGHGIRGSAPRLHWPGSSRSPRGRRPERSSAQRWQRRRRPSRAAARPAPAS